METATVRAPQPGKQKGRPVAGRPLTIQVISNNTGDTAQALRVQRLKLLGIIGQRASLLADLAWEVQHG
jgi:hypothetical protein